MVRMTVTLVPGVAGGRDMVAAIKSVSLATRWETGCIGGFTCFDESDGTVHHVEDWASECDFKRRVISESFTELLQVLEAAGEPPLVRFDFVSASRGLDYVTEVRLVAELAG